MTLQSSGVISLGNVQTEFGGSNPIGITEYYGADDGVPASGTISLSDFYGQSAINPVYNPAALTGSWTEANGSWSVGLNTGTASATKVLIVGVWCEHSSGSITVAGRSAQLLSRRAGGVSNYVEFWGVSLPNIGGTQTITRSAASPGDARRTALCTFSGDGIDLSNIVDVQTSAGSALTIAGNRDGVIVAAACNRYSPYSGSGWSSSSMSNIYYSNAKGEGYWTFGWRTTPTTGNYTVNWPYPAGSYRTLIAVSLTGV